MKPHVFKPIGLSIPRPPLFIKLPLNLRAQSDAYLALLRTHLSCDVLREIPALRHHAGLKLHPRRQRLLDAVDAELHDRHALLRRATRSRRAA